MNLKEKLQPYEVEAKQIKKDIDAFMEAKKDYIELTGIPNYIVKLILHNFTVYLKHERGLK